jgi:hypothetical protein
VNPAAKSPNWLILTALAMEERAIAAEVGEYIRPGAVSLQIIGIKAIRINPESVSQSGAVILAGLAGGLNPALKAGDIIAEASANSPWNDLPFRAGRVHTSDHVIASPAEKQRLFRETACDAVDMEGGVVRRLADSAGVPMLHIRAISDSANETVPVEMMSWIDDVGKPLPGRIAANLALHPGQIPAMIRLGKNSRLALANLARAVRQIVQSRIDP